MALMVNALKRDTIDTNAHKGAADPGETPPPRRRFLTGLWLLLGGVAAAELVGLVVAFLKPGKPVSAIEGFGGPIACGPVDDFSVKTVTAFQQGQFYLSRLENGGFMAVSRKCTHLGCTVIWDEAKGRFECPCHASAFDRAGDVLSKPAPRALDYYPVVIENNQVTVDTGRRLKRRRFSPDQVTKA